MAPLRFAFGPFVLDAGNGALFERSLPVAIGSKPLALLQALVEARGIAALAGVPAGRLVDRIGSTKTIIAGLGGVAAGSALMVLLPGTFRIGGYVSALAVITTGYALFQAANNTAVMKSVAADQRGLTGALLGLSRNLGLITGASAMGAIFSWTSQGIALLRLDGGGQAGMELTFVSATALAGLALLVSWWGTRTRGDQDAASFPAISEATTKVDSR